VVVVGSLENSGAGGDAAFEGEIPLRLALGVVASAAGEEVRASVVELGESAEVQRTSALMSPHVRQCGDPSRELKLEGRLNPSFILMFLLSPYIPRH